MKLGKVFSIIFLINLGIFFIIYSIDEGFQGLIWLCNFKLILENLFFTSITSALAFGYFFLLRKTRVKIAIVLSCIFSALTIISALLIIALLIRL